MSITAQPTGILEYRIYGQDGEFVQLTCQDTPSLRRFVEWVRIHDRRSPSQMAKGEGA